MVKRTGDGEKRILYTLPTLVNCLSYEEHPNEVVVDHENMSACSPLLMDF